MRICTNDLKNGFCLTDWVQAYATRLQKPIDTLSQVRILRSNWLSIRGQRFGLQSIRHFFRTELDRLGSAPALLREYLSELRNGITGASFHPLIHLGYGVEMMNTTGYTDILIDGLSYLLHSWRYTGMSLTGSINSISADQGHIPSFPTAILGHASVVQKAKRTRSPLVLSGSQLAAAARTRQRLIVDDGSPSNSPSQNPVPPAQADSHELLSVSETRERMRNDVLRLMQSVQGDERIVQDLESNLRHRRYEVKRARANGFHRRFICLAENALVRLNSAHTSRCMGTLTLLQGLATRKAVLTPSLSPVSSSSSELWSSGVSFTPSNTSSIAMPAASRSLDMMPVVSHASVTRIPRAPPMAFTPLARSQGAVLTAPWGQTTAQVGDDHSVNSAPSFLETVAQPLHGRSCGPGQREPPLHMVPAPRPIHSSAQLSTHELTSIIQAQTTPTTLVRSAMRQTTPIQAPALGIPESYHADYWSHCSQVEAGDAPRTSEPATGTQAAVSMAPVVTTVGREPSAAKPQATGVKAAATGGNLASLLTDVAVHPGDNLPPKPARVSYEPASTASAGPVGVAVTVSATPTASRASLELKVSCNTAPERSHGEGPTIITAEAFAGIRSAARHNRERTTSIGASTNVSFVSSPRGSGVSQDPSFDLSASITPSSALSDLRECERVTVRPVDTEPNASPTSGRQDKRVDPHLTALIDAAMEGLLQVAVDLFANVEPRRANDFHLLHGVTSANALRHVIAYISEPTGKIDAMAAYINGLALTYIARGMPRVDTGICNRVYTGGLKSSASPSRPNRAIPPPHPGNAPLTLTTMPSPEPMPEIAEGAERVNHSMSVGPRESRPGLQPAPRSPLVVAWIRPFFRAAGAFRDTEPHEGTTEGDELHSSLIGRYWRYGARAEGHRLVQRYAAEKTLLHTTSWREIREMAIHHHDEHIFKLVAILAELAANAVHEVDGCGGCGDRFVAAHDPMRERYLRSIALAAVTKPLMKAPNDV